MKKREKQPPLHSLLHFAATANLAAFLVGEKLIERRKSHEYIDYSRNRCFHPAKELAHIPIEKSHEEPIQTAHHEKDKGNNMKFHGRIKTHWIYIF